jgi:hypothetical protein
LGRSGERVLNTPCTVRPEVVARVRDQLVAASVVQPGDYEDLVADVEVIDRGSQPRVEDERRRWYALVGLARGRPAVEDRRLDVADRLDGVPTLGVCCCVRVVAHRSPRNARRARRSGSAIISMAHG